MNSGTLLARLWETMDSCYDAPPRTLTERLLSRFFKINRLATPFLSDDGTGEDDYALLPPPKPLRILQLTGITFFAVSGSAYGIEETVSAGGPLLALVGLGVASAVWSAPMALVSCELSVALPHSGGYIVWVNSAFGPLVSLLNGVANFLCNIFDCALYPLLLTGYLQRLLLPFLPPEPHGGSGSWWRLAPDVLGTALRLLLVLLATSANILPHAGREPPCDGRQARWRCFCDVQEDLLN